MNSVLLDDGTKIEILLNFKNKNDNFIFYKEENSKNVYASKYYEKDNNIILDEIKSDDDWDFVDQKYQEFLGDEDDK